MQTLQLGSKLKGFSRFPISILLSALALCAGLQASDSDIQDSETLRRQREYEVLMSERQAAGRFSEDLRKAWNAFGSLNMAEAIELFERLNNAPNAAQGDRVQALYGLGLCYRYSHLKEDKYKAREYFNQLVEAYPQNSAAAWALLELGIMENIYTLEGKLEARRHYQRLLRNYPLSLAIHETALRLTDTYLGKIIDPTEIETGLSILEKHIDKYPDNPLVGSMHYRVGYFYFACLQDYEKSLPHSVANSTLRMEDPYRWPEDFWHTAMNFMRLNRVEEALPWFQKIVNESPCAREALPAKEMIERINRYLENRSKGDSISTQ